MEQRIIKYRSWHKDGAHTLSSVASLVLDNPSGPMLVYTNDYAEPWEDNDCVLMQFTGLKDKNGAEIYEGDVIDTFNALQLERGLPHDVRGVVRYKEEAGYFFLELDEKFYSLMSRLEAPEVIGNVW